jgi:hypothetical protein
MAVFADFEKQHGCHVETRWRGDGAMGRHVTDPPESFAAFSLATVAVVVLHRLA